MAGCWRFHPDGGRSLCLPGAGCFIRNPPAGHLLLHDRASRARHDCAASYGSDRDADGRPPTDRGVRFKRLATIGGGRYVVCACHGNGDGSARTYVGLTCEGVEWTGDGSIDRCSSSSPSGVQPRRFSVLLGFDPGPIGDGSDSFRCAREKYKAFG